MLQSNDKKVPNDKWLRINKIPRSILKPRNCIFTIDKRYFKPKPINSIITGKTFLDENPIRKNLHTTENRKLNFNQKLVIGFEFDLFVQSQRFLAKLLQKKSPIFKICPNPKCLKNSKVDTLRVPPEFKVRKRTISNKNLDAISCKRKLNFSDNTNNSKSSDCKENSINIKKSKIAQNAENCGNIEKFQKSEMPKAVKIFRKDNPLTLQPEIIPPKYQNAEEFYYSVNGFPDVIPSESNLNGNYVPIGRKDGRLFFCNKHFVYLFFKEGTWRVSPRLWSDQVIGYTRQDDLLRAESSWNVVDAREEYSSVTVKVTRAEIKQKPSRSAYVELSDWYIEPKLINVGDLKQKRVALKILGFRTRKNLFFKSRYIARRVSPTQFITIDGMRLKLKGKLHKKCCDWLARSAEAKFLKLLEDGLPANFMQIVELLI